MTQRDWNQPLQRLHDGFEGLILILLVTGLVLSYLTCVPPYSSSEVISSNQSTLMNATGSREMTATPVTCVTPSCTISISLTQGITVNPELEPPRKCSYDIGLARNTAATIEMWISYSALVVFILMILIRVYVWQTKVRGKDSKTLNNVLRTHIWDIALIFIGTVLMLAGLLIAGYFGWSGLGYALFDVGLGSIIVYAIVENFGRRSFANQWKSLLDTRFHDLIENLMHGYLTVVMTARQFKTTTVQECDEQRDFLQWGKKPLEAMITTFGDILPPRLRVALSDCLNGLNDVLNILDEIVKVGKIDGSDVITFQELTLNFVESVCTMIDNLGDYTPDIKPEAFHKYLETYRKWYAEYGEKL